MPGHYKKKKGTVRIPVIPYDPNTEANSPPPLPPLPRHNPFEGKKEADGSPSNPSKRSRRNK